MDKPVSVRDFAMSLPTEGSAVVLAMQERIEALEAALKLVATLVDYLPHPHCIRAGLVIRQALNSNVNKEETNEDD